MTDVSEYFVHHFWDGDKQQATLQVDIELEITNRELETYGPIVDRIYDVIREESQAIQDELDETGELSDE